MRVKFHKKFEKILAKSPPWVEAKLYDRLLLFEQNPNNPLLKNHSVDAAYPGWWSINITGDWRALYEPKDENLAVFMKIGTRSQLYK